MPGGGAEEPVSALVEAWESRSLDTPKGTSKVAWAQGLGLGARPQGKGMGVVEGVGVPEGVREAVPLLEEKAVGEAARAGDGVERGEVEVEAVEEVEGVDWEEVEALLVGVREGLRIGESVGGATEGVEKGMEALWGGEGVAARRGEGVPPAPPSSLPLSVGMGEGVEARPLEKEPRGDAEAANRGEDVSWTSGVEVAPGGKEGVPPPAPSSATPLGPPEEGEAEEEAACAPAEKDAMAEGVGVCCTEEE